MPLASSLRQLAVEAQVARRGRMIQGLLTSGALPALERSIQFAAARHQQITHSIANLSTPNYRPTDLPPEDFQQALARAVEDRRQRTGGPNGELKMGDTRHMRFRDDGIEIREQHVNDNILFHDRNNRSLEHLMQNLAENAMTHNAAIEMLKSEFNLMETAIRERL
jgi:flagellar basal-body rod protein FlgB